MKTFLAMLILCSACLAQQKPVDPQLRRQQNQVRNDVMRKASKLNAADLATIKAVLDKYPDRVRPATNAAPAKAAPAPVKKKK